MEIAQSFLHLVFVGVVALFPPVNPVGTALIINPFLSGLNDQQRKAASLRIALYCFSLCAVTLLIGSWIFKLFGISLPIVQAAGGLLICRMGWDLLSSGDGKQDSSESTPAQDGKNIDNLLFYPLAFPMTTGAGTISVLLTLSAHGHDGDLTMHMVNLMALFVSAILTAVMIYSSDAYTPALLRRLGPKGSLILNRLSAFLVFCVGLQIASSGVLSLVKQGAG